MKSPTSKERLLVHLDPAAFLADSELIRALEKRSTPVPCTNDRILFQQDGPAVGVYIIHHGNVALTMISPEGQEILCAQVTAGSLLGLPGIIGEKPYSLTATARAGALVSFVSRDDFFALMHADPLLALKMLQVLAAEVRGARLAIA